MMHSRKSSVLLLSFASLTNLSESFVVAPPKACAPKTSCHAFLPSSNMLAVEFFDGSQVVDPVVVSGVFWSSLKAKFVSLVIGQLLATLLFGLLTTVAASQVNKLGDWVSTSLGSAVKSKIQDKTSGFKTADQVKNFKTTGNQGSSYT